MTHAKTIKPRIRILNIDVNFGHESLFIYIYIYICFKNLKGMSKLPYCNISNIFSLSKYFHPFFHYWVDYIGLWAFKLLTEVGLMDLNVHVLGQPVHFY